MQPYMKPLLAARLIFEGDATAISPYAVNMANGRIQTLPGGGKANGKYYPMIKTLGPMARAMDYLVIQSLSSFETVLKDIESSGAKALTSSPAFRDIMRETNVLRAKNGYVGHPKMDKLRSMCIEHFVAAENEVDEDGKKKETRVMVFCNFRAVVDEIVDCLNQQRPLIKATAFVGQGTAKGVKGRTQKDQIEVRRFACKSSEAGADASCRLLRSSRPVPTTFLSLPRSERRDSTLARSTSSSAMRRTSLQFEWFVPPLHNPTSRMC